MWKMPQTMHKNGPDPNLRYNALTTQDENSVNIDDFTLDDKQAEHVQAECGLGALRCRRLQILAHPNAFVVFIGLLFMASFGASGFYMGGVISTIEKRFQLKSSESGILLAMNDVTALCGVLFVAHFGGRSHRPRIIGIAGLVIALGTFVTALPQFIFDNPGLNEFVSSNNQSIQATKVHDYEKEFTCNARVNVSECTLEEIELSGSQLAKTWPMILGQLLCGLGGCALLPLSQTYIDDAVERTILPIYIALMFLPMTIASLFGYSISGYCLSLFTDFYKTDVSELGISPRDPQWQGAWWLGFIIYGCFLCMFSIPFFFFPRKMNKPKSYFCCTRMPDCCKALLMKRGRSGQSDGNEATTDDMNTHKDFSSKPMAVIKEFLACLRRLLTNPIYMSAVSGKCMMAMSASGFVVFAAKYVQFQFDMSPSQAGPLLGFSVMPGTLIGLLLGGIITSRVASRLRGYAVVTVIIHILSVTVFGVMLFLGCSNLDIAGLTTNYSANSPQHEANGLNIFASCNMNCSCEKGVYSPVCGANNVTYVTPCFAGCKTSVGDQLDKTIYQECSCINTTPGNIPEEPTSGVAVSDACAKSCDLVTAFVIFLGLSSAFGAFTYDPSFMVLFRSVADKDRHLALGLASFLYKTVALIPSPVIFGAAIETQCSYWQESCQETGECILYDRPGLRFVFLGMTGGFKFLAFLCFCSSAYFIFKKEVQEPETDKDSWTKENVEEAQETRRESNHKETTV